MPRLYRLGVPAVVALGLALRIAAAARGYLNPDEIQYFFLALPGSLKGLYLSSLATDHPPLLFMLVHPIAAVTSSELALRLIPLLAGAILPWVVYRWLSAVWNPGAGFAALCFLALSPNLVWLSAQFRGYSLELLLAGVALFFLDLAVRGRSARAMVAFDAALLLAILTEYSAVWFAAAAGVYFLLQAYRRKLPRGVLAVWAAGQVVALTTLAGLFVTLIKPRLDMRGGTTESYLRAAFPDPHQNLLVFGITGTAKQFVYVFSSYAAGIGAAALFLLGLAVLWREGASGKRAPDRIFALLLAMPLVLFYIGALLGLQPYGRSRHSALLALFLAAGAGLGLEKLVRSRRWLGGICAVAVAAVWIFAPTLDPQNIRHEWDRKQSMAAAILSVRNVIPPGSVVLANRQTNRYLRFYWSRREALGAAQAYDEQEGPPVGSLRVVYRHWNFDDVDDFLADLALVRTQFGISKDAPVWVLDGGFTCELAGELRRRFPGIAFPPVHDFGGGINLFQTPPGI